MYGCYLELLPFYACSDDERDIATFKKLQKSKNVTVRNDPDGRSRLNVNIFDGNIIVTDFGDVPLLGNIQTNTLQEAYEKWSASKTAKSLSCHCPAVKMSWTECSCKKQLLSNRRFLIKNSKYYIIKKTSAYKLTFFILLRMRRRNEFKI